MPNRPAQSHVGHEFASVPNPRLAMPGTLPVLAIPSGPPKPWIISKLRDSLLKLDLLAACNLGYDPSQPIHRPMAECWLECSSSGLLIEGQ